MSDALKVLIVDDSEDDRELYRRCLKQSETPYEITEAENGEEGFALAQEIHPHCILLDYSLPGRNGVEVLKRIRTKDTFVPVVILTGQGNESVAVAAMKEGAQDYISKATITPEALERVVRVAIAHASMQRRIYEQRTSLEIFTYALAHDLREPANTVRSFVELIMKREPLTEKGKGYFTHVQKAAERMQQLIDAVFIYTRIDAAEQIEKENTTLEDVVKGVEETLAPLITGKKASITAAALPQVEANRTQMMQLFQNLISNAIRHGGENVTIHIGAQEQDENWLISVSDTGPGIEAHHLDKIFEPFKRMSTAERGLGLGLAISRKIVEFHGGKIWCESTPGKGATFFFTLPKAGAQRMLAPPLPAATPYQPEPKHGKQLARILLVDDNEADLALNRIMLIEQTKLQCEILTATDGQQALDKLYEAVEQGNPIDVVILDINMPVMSGFELLAQVHMSDALRDTTVVMCSTSGYDVDRRMAASMGAAGYLTKPPQFDQLKTILKENPHVTLEQTGDAYALLRAA